MPEPAVRRVRPDEGSRYREVRLRALADAPFAFGTTLAEAAARPAAWWDARVASTATGDASSMFVAEVDGRWCGLVGGETLGDTVEVISMWVDPAARRSGVGTRLLDAVVAWAASHGRRTLTLNVTEGNAAAIALYETYGFAHTGEAHTNEHGVRELVLHYGPGARIP